MSFWEQFLPLCAYGEHLICFFSNRHSHELYILGWGVGGLCHLLACQRQINFKGSVAWPRPRDWLLIFRAPPYFWNGWSYGLEIWYMDRVHDRVEFRSGRGAMTPGPHQQGSPPKPSLYFVNRSSLFLMGLWLNFSYALLLIVLVKPNSAI